MIKRLCLCFVLILSLSFCACSLKRNNSDPSIDNSGIVDSGSIDNTGTTDDNTNSGTTDNNETNNDIKDEDNMEIKITVGSHTLIATLSNNSSGEAFYELLKKGALTVEMSDYGNFEKVGEIGTTLPRNDEPITTEPGDIILYLGSNITIYYDTNSWSFTRLGKIENTTKEELLSILGSGDVTVVFSVNE